MSDIPSLRLAQAENTRRWAERDREIQERLNTAATQEATVFVVVTDGATSVTLGVLEGCSTKAFNMDFSLQRGMIFVLTGVDQVALRLEPGNNIVVCIADDGMVVDYTIHSYVNRAGP